MKITIESTPNNNFQIQADGSAEDDPIQVLKLLLNAARALTDALPRMERSPILQPDGRAGLKIVDNK